MDRNKNRFCEDVIMTKIIFFEIDKKFCGFQVKGHSGYAESGQDIVCSAISTACQMTLAGLKEVLKVDVNSVVQDGFMSVVVNRVDIEKAQDLFETLRITLEDIAENYSKFVKMEVKKYVY